MMKTKLSVAALLAMTSLSAEEITLDALSVTATKIATPTKEVSQSIGVVSKEDIENLPMQNITETFSKIPGVSAVSKNGGYDTRVFIRGSGVKARYGVRDIMVLRDGVPMTDPDSFTRFDFIDTQDIEQVEVTKGPGSIYASGSAGGTIQILSKSVFDEQQNRIRVGVGSFGAMQTHIRVGGQIDDNDFFSVTATHKESKNDWRYWNEFSSEQMSFKHGHIFSDDSTLETELSYSKADIQLPSSLTEAEFELYKNTGEVEDKTSSPWQHSGRYSEIVFLNSRYEKDFEGFTFKPQVYYNHWTHNHPVSFMINESPDNNVFGTDVAFEVPHELNSMQSMFLAGITARANLTRGEEKYTYGDVATADVPYGYKPGTYETITSTLSDTKGSLSATSESDTYLYGFYLQEKTQLTEDLSVDIMARLERAEMYIAGNEIIASDYSTVNYKAGRGGYGIDRNFLLSSYRLGTSYAVNDTTNAYATIGYSDQIPNESELKSNVFASWDIYVPELEASKSTNYELGLKHRDEKLFVDATVYYTTIKDDIVYIVDAVGRETYSSYQNAGEVEKKGFELQTEYNFVPSTKIGASYAYSDYQFKDALEYKYDGSSVDLSGKYLPLVPKNQYTLYTSYGKKEGVQASVESQTWGSYYTDNANTEKHEGFKFVTNVNLGYVTGGHRVNLFVNNLFDKQYAVAAKGEINDVLYTPAAPRSIMANYTYQF